jgi:hypothetical protein
MREPNRTIRLPFLTFAMRFRPRFSIFSVLCGATLALSFALPLPRDGAILGLPSLCPFHNWTGIPCPGCGMTRSFVSLAHGQIGAAFEYHPLGPLLFAGAIAVVLGVFWTPRKSVSHRTRQWALALGAVMIAGSWALRLGGVWPLPA